MPRLRTRYAAPAAAIAIAVIAWLAWSIWFDLFGGIYAKQGRLPVLSQNCPQPVQKAVAGLSRSRFGEVRPPNHGQSGPPDYAHKLTIRREISHAYEHGERFFVGAAHEIPGYTLLWVAEAGVMDDSDDQVVFSNAQERLVCRF